MVKISSNGVVLASKWKGFNGGKFRDDGEGDDVVV